MTFIETAINLAYLSPVFIGINELIKKVLPNLNTRFYPLINLGLGFIAYPLLGDLSIYMKIMSCIVLGLSSGGLYDLGKRTILGK